MAPSGQIYVTVHGIRLCMEQRLQSSHLDENENFDPSEVRSSSLHVYHIIKWSLWSYMA